MLQITRNSPHTIPLSRWVLRLLLLLLLLQGLEQLGADGLHGVPSSCSLRGSSLHRLLLVRWRSLLLLERATKRVWCSCSCWWSTELLMSTCARWRSSGACSRSGVTKLRRWLWSWLRWHGVEEYRLSASSSAIRTTGAIVCAKRNASINTMAAQNGCALCVSVFEVTHRVLNRCGGGSIITLRVLLLLLVVVRLLGRWV